MKFKILFFLIILFVSCSGQKVNISEVRQKQLNAQNNIKLLDFERVKDELSKDRKDVGPFNYGIFPYPIYDSISKNSFKGIGSYGNFFGVDLEGKKIVYTSFSENKNNLNEFRVKEKNRIYFTILVLTDFIDDKEFTSSQMQIVSRNFPDVIGQGFVKTSKNRIDFSAFITIENDEFAIVNMKLYNLKYGNIILIAPQKDGSLRSIQLKEKQDLNSETLKNYVETLVKKQEIKDFFINKDTI